TGITHFSVVTFNSGFTVSFQHDNVASFVKTESNQLCKYQSAKNRIEKSLLLVKFLLYMSMGRF
ncbi:TPA: hypothetical protein ACIUKI_002320, partial [Salmonella enterica subsp. enterica serovar Birkenhead]